MEKKNKKPTVLARLQVLHEQVGMLIAEEVRKSTREREYVIGSRGVFHGHGVSEVVDYYGKTFPFNAETEFVPANASTTFCFGVEHVVEESVIPGVPETTSSHFGVEHPFALQHLLINDEDAPHFEVVGVFVGGGSAIPMNTFRHIPASRFAESVEPRVLFKGAASSKLDPVCVMVKNTSTEPRKFRARVIGREVFMPAAPDVEFVFPEMDERGLPVKP